MLIEVKLYLSDYLIFLYVQCIGRVPVFRVSKINMTNPSREQERGKASRAFDLPSGYRTADQTGIPIVCLTISLIENATEITCMYVITLFDDLGIIDHIVSLRTPYELGSAFRHDSRGHSVVEP